MIPHKATWHSDFEKEKRLILALQNKYIRAVEHVGSTSVPGMPAKPIIDIIVGIDTYRNKGKLVRDLSSIGYDFRLEPRRYQSLFIKVKGERITHHLKVLRYKGVWWKEYMTFKGQLLHDKKSFESYRNIKLRLGKEFSDDRKAYTRAKSESIKAILAKKTINATQRTS